MNDTQQKAIVTNSQAIVMPAVNAQEAIEAWKIYQDLKSKIVDKSDIQVIQDKEFLKKSYWRKIATFFNLSVEIVSESHEMVGKTMVWHFTCRATAPNGRSAIGTGSCDAFEKATLKDGKYMVRYWNKRSNMYDYRPAEPNSIHNIRTTAETRAFNRAVSNLVGGGEASAEEIVGEVLDEEGHETPLKSHPGEPQKPLGRPTWCDKHKKPMVPIDNGKVGHVWKTADKNLYCDGQGWHDYKPAEKAA